MKMFCAIKFKDNKHAVVPSNWILRMKNQIYCKWPLSIVENKARMGADPEENWKSHLIKEVLVESKTYTGCESKIYTPGGCSSTETDVELTPQRSILPPTPTFTLHRHTPASQASDSSKVELLMLQVAKLEKKMLPIARNVEQILSYIEKINNNSSKEKQTLNPENSLPRPAETFEELDTLGKHESLVMVLQELCGISLMESTRKIMRRIMCRELAMQTSYSGLGIKRQRSKFSFKDHDILRPILVALHNKGYINEKQNAIAIQRIIRSACHWDGNRIRKKNSPVTINELIPVAALVDGTTTFDNKLMEAL